MNMELSRRQFMHGAGAGIAGTTLGALGFDDLESAYADSIRPWKLANLTETRNPAQDAFADRSVRGDHLVGRPQRRCGRGRDRAHPRRNCGARLRYDRRDKRRRQGRRPGDSQSPGRSCRRSQGQGTARPARAVVVRSADRGQSWRTQRVNRK